MRWFICIAMVLFALVAAAARADDAPKPAAAPDKQETAPAQPAAGTLQPDATAAKPDATAAHPEPDRPGPEAGTANPAAKTEADPAKPEAMPPKAETPPSSIQHVSPTEAEAILGRRVTDTEGKDVGRLVDVLVDENGQPQAAVIDFGGFMGVGNRKIAVHWSALHFNPGDLKHIITLEMTPDQLKAAPEFTNVNKPAPVVTPADTIPQAR